MCTHQRYIKNSQGRDVLVSCGKCKACLQEKAINRANRIRNNVSDDTLCIMVGLTYRNECVPYIRLDDVVSNIYYCENDSTSFEVRLPLYRDKDVVWKRCSYKDYLSSSLSKRFSSIGKTRTTYYHNVDVDVDSPIGDCVFKIPSEFKYSDYHVDDFFGNFYHSSYRYRPVLDEFHNLKCLKGKPGCVGISLYSDLQNFFKRLRINLKRRYNYEKSFSFYACSEYGSVTCRPHFHVLIFIPKRDYSLFKSAIVQSWQFDDSSEVRKSITIARNAAAYVSSYVNCDTYLPRLLSMYDFKPKHSYSQGFGLSKECFSLRSVYEMFKRGDLRFDSSKIVNGQSVTTSLFVPYYVVNRYAPKFKGYCRLTSDEIRLVVTRPEYLDRYAERLSLDRTDLHRIKTMLRNKKKLWYSCGFTSFEFSDFYSGVYTSLASQRYRFSREFLDVKSVFTYYYNISDFYYGSVSNSVLDDLIFQLPSDFHYILDYNKFPDVVRKTYNLENSFNSYSKDKRVRNSIYSLNHNF